MKQLFLLLLLICQLSIAQSLAPLSKVPLIADRFIGFDNYKNSYFVKNRVINKQGPDGNFIFNDLQLGRITSVDIINPLKVVAFFQDTNTVVMLDNKLNEIERINFNNLPLFLNVSTATNAGNNSLWLFNVDTQQLEMYNYGSKLQTVVSQPFPGKLLSQASNFNYCFTLTEKKLRAFNIYGSILNEVPSEGYEKIIQQNENLVALKENSLYYIPDFAKRNDAISRETVKLSFPEITIKDLQLTNDFLYIYDGEILHTFKLTPPIKE
ncbi:hypothetical protein [Aequorivita lipolytica]|uniref:6-bladed beta-propeller n=1 Tax=Aequorivita lipolytica TaxID=153267 RepID=A0A5C6YTP6_9FLAO|nr:hypothetical protein [Aequorivita lipolytica]TXD70786.1 hypothetical protein ESV24_01450 [Aequorivita lipolytica]SRX49830.1 hypothetical protein AEQU2_00295 [Aequorivita lipolytica]